MKAFAALLLLALTVSAQTTNDSSVSSPGTYMITFAKKISPGVPLPIQVEILNATGPVIIRIDLVNTSSSPEHEIHSMTDVFEQGTPKEVNFMIPKDMKSNNYYYRGFRLDFTGFSGLTFKGSEFLEYRHKSKSIFVQTDKAMYKPGQPVNIRIVAVYADLKVINESMDIIIYDPSRNRVKQWLNATGPNGVISRTLSTSYELVLGDWTIEVILDGYKETKTFTIDEYVLPKFEVGIKLPSFVLTNESQVPVQVTAMYTHGRGLDGSARVRVSGHCYFLYYYYRGPHGQQKKHITRDIVVTDGKGMLTLEVEDLRNLWNVTQNESINYCNMLVEANVTEGVTGNKIQAGDARTQFFERGYQYKFLDVCPRTIKPGLTYRCLLQVVKRDGQLTTTVYPGSVNLTVTYTKYLPTTPAPPSTSTTTDKPDMILEKNETKSNSSNFVDSIMVVDPDFRRPYYPYYRPTETLTLESNIRMFSEDSLVEVSFEVPPDAEYVSLQALSVDKDALDSYHSASRSYSPSDTYLQLSVSNGAVKVGELAVLQLKATEPMQEVTYKVMSRGRLVTSKTETFTRNNTQTLFIPMTGEMAPNPQIVVFFKLSDGEIVADGVSIKVEGLFDNKVTVEFSEKIVKPGDHVQLTVTADPNSLVFLLSRDLSVLLLKSGNDITPKSVSRELMSYDYGSYFGWFDTWYSGLWWPRSFGGTDAHSIFSGANIGVVTDANLYQHKQDYYSVYTHDMLRVAGPPESQAVDDAAGGAFKQELQPIEKIRKFFPETWLWDTVAVGENGVSVEEMAAPDTITTWITSAFAVGSDERLSVADKTANLTTERKFFLRLELPYSVVRKEEFSLHVSVFNNYDRSLPALVTLKQTDGFENIFLKRNPKNGEIEKTISTAESSDVIMVPAGEALSVSFAIKPIKVGKLKLEMWLKTYDWTLPASVDQSIPVDAVERELLVEPEGTERVQNHPLFIDDRETGSSREELDVIFPENTVQDSESLMLSVAGDVLGASLNNIENLVKMPYGCGEQNMVNFAPNIYVMNYLQRIGKLTAELKEKMETYMEKGYQRELRYKHRAGCYSAFGENRYSSNNCSMWLTAFVLKCFTQAYPLIPDVIDPVVVTQGLYWITVQQNPDGSFPENGRVFNKRLQGGASNGIALTAYVAMALKHAQISKIQIETGYKIPYDEIPGGKQKEPRPSIDRVQSFETSSNGSVGNDGSSSEPGFMLPKKEEYFVLDEKKLDDAIQKAQDFLEDNLNSLKTVYEKVLVAHTLKLLGSTKAAEALTKVEELAIYGPSSKYWSDPDPPVPQDYVYPWTPKTEAKSVEMTAYVLMTYALNGYINRGWPTLRWLSNQRNEKGGYASTQETVVALQALSEFASSGAIYDSSSQMTIDVQFGQFSKTYYINAVTSLTLQLDALPVSRFTQKLVVETRGNGFALLEVSKKYNVLMPAENPYFTLTVAPMEEREFTFKLSICFRHTGLEASGMAILKIGLVTGYEADVTNEAHTIQIVRSENVGKWLYLYFNEVPTQESCVTVRMTMVGETYKSEATSVSLLDYYEPKFEVKKDYQISEKMICKVCRNPCPFSCRKSQPVF